MCIYRVVQVFHAFCSAFYPRDTRFFRKIPVVLCCIHCCVLTDTLQYMGKVSSNRKYKGNSKYVTSAYHNNKKSRVCTCLFDLNATEFCVINYPDNSKSSPRKGILQIKVFTLLHIRGCKYGDLYYMVIIILPVEVFRSHNTKNLSKENLHTTVFTM